MVQGQRCIFFLFFLFLPLHLRAEQDQELIKRMDNLPSEERIRLLCLYYDTHIHSKDPGKYNHFIAECDRIAQKDKDNEFKSYIDFYRRVSAVMLISDDEIHARKLKMLPIWAEALKHYQLLGDERFMALCHAYRGHVYFMTKDYAKSIEELLMADEGIRRVGYHRFPDISKHLHNMALVFYFFRYYDKVAELMETSATIPPYSANYDIQRYNTLGATYTHLKQYAKAKKAFLKTRETATAYNDPVWIAISSRGLAQIYSYEKNYKEALNVYLSTLSIYEDEKHKGYKREYSEHLLGLAKTYVAMNDLPGARKYLNRINYSNSSNTENEAFIFGVTYQDINYWLGFYDVQHRYHDALKDYEKAYHYSDSLYSIKYKLDSLFNGLEIQIAQNRIEARDKQYENDKKEATIKSKNGQMLLVIGILAVITVATIQIIRKNRQINSQNKLINRQIEDLTRMLEQKQVLLSELQHRIKNNLQHVISILEIQKESVGFNNIEELIRGNQNRIHSMALLHKKLNVSENVNEVELKRYLTELAEIVKESYDSREKTIRLNMNFEVEKCSIEKALPLGLIIVELLSNSMKHAFRERSVGIIHIELIQDKGINRLYYTDNGEGYDFNKTSKKGLGLEIIKGLIDQLDGRTETNNENGFELRVYFKG